MGTTIVVLVWGGSIVYAFYIIQKSSLLWGILYVLAYAGYFFYLLKFSCTGCPYWKREGCPLGFNKISHQLFGGFDEEEDAELIEKVRSASSLHSTLSKLIWFALDVVPIVVALAIWFGAHSPSKKLHVLYVLAGYCVIFLLKPVLHKLFLCSTCERDSGCWMK